MTIRCRRPLCMLAAILWLCAGPALAQERRPVSALKPLLAQAIDQGAAHGVLAGDAATFMQGKFATGAPILIDVRSLHPLPQPGCHRLEVSTRQAGVLERGRREDKALVWQLSYCRDGRLAQGK